MRAFLSCCILAALTGCVTVPPPTPLAKPAADQAQIYVYFLTSLSCSSLTLDVTIDGQPAAHIAPREYFKVDVTPGHHTIAAHDPAEVNPQKDLSFDVDVPGGAMIFRGLSAWGINCSPPDMVDTTESDFTTGRRDLKQIQARQPGQILSAPEFAAALAYYQTANPKPTIPEAVRRLQIQAEAAIKENNYQEAEQHFAEAIKLAPWWANGYYNHALILKELNEYTQAIEEMKRYLALNPKGSDVREMQDMIYLWQRKAGQ